MNVAYFSNRRRWLWSLAALGVSSAAGIGSWLYWAKESKHSLSIAGSGLMQALNQELALAYVKQQPKLDIFVEAGGSMASLIALKRKAIDIAAMSEAFNDIESDMQIRAYLIARNSIAFIAHRSAGVSTLSQVQVRAILLGQIKNWRELGGVDLNIRVLRRKPDSSIQDFVEDIVLGHADMDESMQLIDDAQTIYAEVAQDKRSFAYVTQQEMQLGINAVIDLKIDALEFSRASILAARYPYIQDLFYVCRAEEHAQLDDFLRFVRSLTGKEIIERHNLISLY